MIKNLPKTQKAKENIQKDLKNRWNSLNTQAGIYNKLLKEIETKMEKLGQEKLNLSNKLSAVKTAIQDVKQDRESLDKLQISVKVSFKERCNRVRQALPEETACYETDEDLIPHLGIFEKELQSK